MVEEESKPEENTWAKAIQVFDVRHIDMFEYTQLTEHGMTRQEAREVAQEYQIKVEEERELDMVTEEVFAKEKELYKEYAERAHASQGEYYEPGTEDVKKEAEELEAELKKGLKVEVKKNDDEDEVDLSLSLPSTSQHSQEQCPDLDTKLHDHVTQAVWSAIIEANHQNEMDDGDIPKAFDKAWSALSDEQKIKLNQEYQMNLGSASFAKFIHMKEADAKVYEELRNEMLAPENPAMEASSDEDIEFEVSYSSDLSNAYKEGSDDSDDDDDAEINLDYDYNNNSDREDSTEQKEVEPSDATDEVSEGEEKEDADSSFCYSFEEVTASDTSEQDMQEDAKPGGMKFTFRRHEISPTHVLPKHMVDWSKDIERRYENIAKLHTETLKQMIDLQIEVDKHIHPRRLSETQKEMLALQAEVEKKIKPRKSKRPREEYEDAENEDKG